MPGVSRRKFFEMVRDAMVVVGIPVVVNLNKKDDKVEQLASEALVTAYKSDRGFASSFYYAEEF